MELVEQKYNSHYYFNLLFISPFQGLDWFG